MNKQNTELTINYKLESQYRFEKFKTDNDGNEIPNTRQQLTGWSKNIITNDGLDAIGSIPQWTIPSTFLFNKLAVGSGSTPETETDSNLISLVAQTTDIFTATSTLQNTTTPYYGMRTITFRFATGQLNGTISEVGIFTSSNVLFSRTLIKNEFNSPISITIMADESLDVIFQIRNYVPVLDVSYGPINISGVDYSGTYRARSVSMGSLDMGNWAFGGVGATNNGGLLYTGYNGNTRRTGVSATQTLTAVTAEGDPTGGYITSYTFTPYSPGDHYIDHELYWALTAGNTGSGIGTLIIVTRLGTHQMNFNLVIDKNSSKKLKLNIRISWGRYIP